MKIAEALLASVMVCAALATTAMAADSPPPWAYIDNNPNYKPPVDDGNLVRVQTARQVIPGVSCGTDSSRQSGTRAITGHCRTS